jgi:hypothetical protein
MHYYVFLLLSEILLWSCEHAESARAALSLSGTMLGFYPVKVLPSKTAILPVNPTFLPSVSNVHPTFLPSVSKVLLVVGYRKCLLTLTGTLHASKSVR